MQMKRFCIIIPDGTLAPFYEYVQVGYGPTLLLHQHNTCANAASLPPSTLIVLTLFQGTDCSSTVSPSTERLCQAKPLS